VKNCCISDLPADTLGSKKQSSMIKTRSLRRRYCVPMVEKSGRHVGGVAERLQLREQSHHTAAQAGHKLLEKQTPVI